MMKAKLILAVAATLLVSGVCAQPRPQSAPAGKVLVVYYSHSGNTRAMARRIARVSGGELFEIVPATPYPSDHRLLVGQAKREIEAGARPALKSRVGDMSQYGVVFIGSPCWWSTVAPPVASFLASCDLSGKTVVPFMTHGGSGMGRSEADIRRLCPRSHVADGLSVRGSLVDGSMDTVGTWTRACLESGF